VLVESPPPAGSNNDVLRFRSAGSLVIAPANTGSDKSRRGAVTPTDHTKMTFVLVIFRLLVC